MGHIDPAAFVKSYDNCGSENVTVSDPDQLAQDFEGHRAHLRAMALRMLGSRQEAEDAVQEAWLRLCGPDTAFVGNPGGWLTTVVSRLDAVAEPEMKVGDLISA